MRAIVVGGGVAGPATALALHRAGIESVVLERRPEIDPDEGSYLTVAPNGVDALATLGVLDATRAVAVPSRTNRMFGATGRMLGKLSLGRPAPDGTVALTLKRSGLAAVLEEQAAARGVELRTGARVTSVEQDDSGVRAVLDDGALVQGDVLVGADGVHSLVRRTIDPSAPAPRYVGLTNFGGITRGTHLAGTLQPESWHFVFGARCFFGAHPTPDGDVVWFVNVPRQEISREERASTSLKEWRSWLGDLARDDAGPAHELIGAGQLELAGDNTYDLPRVPTWWSGRTVLVGDAAHAPSPSSGQGASLALEDAVVLAQSLRDTPEVPEALASYESVRRERVEKIVAVGARGSSAKIPGPVGRRFQDAILSLVFRYAVTEERTEWMTGHRIPWTSTMSR